MVREKAIGVYNALTDTEKGNYKVLVRKFQEYIQGKKDIANEQYWFNTRTQ